ncbi:MAG: rhodanese-like domain-containing protein [Planctomycetota bacterium]|jgi:3-mercaptopyruvate sulfurtransferase SseA
MARTTAQQALALLGLGAVFSWLALLAGGRVGAGETAQLLTALEAQVPVLSWRTNEAAARQSEDLLIVDGRPAAAHRAGRPRGALHVPFAAREARVYALPEDRQVRAVLVVMGKDEAAQARALAQWCAREWALPVVATLDGGWPAWQAARLPVAEEE